MTRFNITEARARFCYHPGVVHTVMSERRAGELMAAAARAEGKFGAIPKSPDEIGGRGPSRVAPDVVLPMLAAGMTVQQVADKLGVSASTIHDRKRLWNQVGQRGRR